MTRGGATTSSDSGRALTAIGGRRISSSGARRACLENHSAGR
jgi:hypothetical protein